MGGLQKCTYCLLISWILMMESSNLESRGVPSVGLSPGTSSNSSRVKRSCGNHSVGLIYLEACNRNHKRSPFIINVILMEYYIVPEQEGFEKDDLGTVANRETKLHELQLPTPIISAWIITSTDHEDEDGRRIHPNGDMDRSLNRLPISSTSRQRERPKRVPAAGVNFQTLLEKCCSLNGCGFSDFSNLC